MVILTVIDASWIGFRCEICTAQCTRDLPISLDVWSFQVEQISVAMNPNLASIDEDVFYNLATIKMIDISGRYYSIAIASMTPDLSSSTAGKLGYKTFRFSWSLIVGFGCVLLQFPSTSYSAYMPYNLTEIMSSPWITDQLTQADTHAENWRSKRAVIQSNSKHTPIM